jgi:hypothetical protein
MRHFSIFFGLVLAITSACADSSGPADAVLASGTVTLPTFQGIDMETGAFSSSSTTADLYAHTIGNPPYFELVAPGARSDYVYFGTKAPKRSDCHGGLAQNYHLDTLPGDVYSCIVTPEGHYGYFHFPVWPAWGMDSVRIAYVLWAD